MKTFVIKFFYYTDLRGDVVVKAHDEVRALAIALTNFNGVDSGSWITWPGFRIEISTK